MPTEVRNGETACMKEVLYSSIGFCGEVCFGHLVVVEPNRVVFCCGYGAVFLCGNQEGHVRAGFDPDTQFRRMHL